MAWQAERLPTHNHHGGRCVAPACCDGSGNCRWSVAPVAYHRCSSAPAVSAAAWHLPHWRGFPSWARVQGCSSAYRQAPSPSAAAGPHPCHLSPVIRAAVVIKLLTATHIRLAVCAWGLLLIMSQVVMTLPGGASGVWSSTTLWRTAGGLGPCCPRHCPLQERECRPGARCTSLEEVRLR